MNTNTTLAPINDPTMSAEQTIVINTMLHDPLFWFVSGFIWFCIYLLFIGLMCLCQSLRKDKATTRKGIAKPKKKATIEEKEPEISVTYTIDDDNNDDDDNTIGQEEDFDEFLNEESPKLQHKTISKQHQQKTKKLNKKTKTEAKRPVMQSINSAKQHTVENENVDFDENEDEPRIYYPDDANTDKIVEIDLQNAVAK